MIEFLPPLIPQAGSGPFQWLNCGLARTAMAIVDHHGGVRPAGLDPALVWPPTPRFLRELSRDTSGGTRLSQHVALAARYLVPIDARYDEPFDDVWAEAESTGKGILLDGAYAGLSPEHRRGSPTFRGNHGVLAIPRQGANDWDALHDGRRPDVPTGPVFTPKDELRSFAGALTFTEPWGTWTLGDGRCYAGLYDASRSQAPLQVPVELGGNTLIYASQGISTTKRMSLPKGTPLFREPGGPRITSMRKDAAPPYIGLAGNVRGTAYRAVLIATSNFHDGESRRVIAYARADAGPIS